MAFLSFSSDPSSDNVYKTLYALVRSQKASVTEVTVRETLLSHPDYPSVLAMSDALSEWHIESAALQLNTAEQLRELPTPFVAHMKRKGGWYVLAIQLTGDSITYQDNERGIVTLTLAEFEKQWSGVVLLAESNERSGEASYVNRHQDERLEQARKFVLLTGILGLVAFATLMAASSLTTWDWLLLATEATGLLTSSLLVGKTLGTTNLLTNQLCRLTAKTNCDKVLNAPAAKLWGWLSWADIGLIYFSGGLVSALLMAHLPTIRPLVYWLSLSSLPYVVFSIYYQARVLKQWCTLCLLVQGLLLTESLLALLQPLILPATWPPYVIFLSLFALPTLLWVAVKPLLIRYREGKEYYKELLAFRRDPDLFNAILEKQPKMPPVPADMQPVRLGNPAADHTITMVTNPYCKPCARKHQELEELTRQNSNVNVQLVFSACDGLAGKRHQAARHLLAQASFEPIESVIKRWYATREFTGRTLRDQEIAVFDAIVQKHCAWCRRAEIELTPTLFVDGYRLPALYQGVSLRWLVNYLPSPSLHPDLAKSL